MIGKERLRELAVLRPAGHKVLSLYLNLDPSEFPTPRDRSVELESLLHTVERELREDSLDHTQREALKHDLERVRAYMKGEFDAKGARGVVVFSASGAGIFEVLKLPESIGSEVVIDDSPFIEPLTKIPGMDRYCVLLINRQVARILLGGTGGMREVTSIVDDVHRWHDQGGWSQARFQRGIVKETQDHIKHAAQELFKRFQDHSFERLIIGAPDEMKGEVEENLHTYVRERIVGWIDVEIRSTPAEVTREATTVIEDDRRKREYEWLERLRSELGRNARGVAGLSPTLAALNERRVEALLLKDGFRAPGWATANADFLSTEAGESPSGEQLRQRDDVIESAIESALEQSAEVIVFHHHQADLEALGSIAAVLRY